MSEIPQSEPIETGNKALDETRFNTAVESAVEFARANDLNYASIVHGSKPELVFFSSNTHQVPIIEPVESPSIKKALLKIIKEQYKDAPTINIREMFKIDTNPGPVSNAEFGEKPGTNDAILYIEK